MTVWRVIEHGGNSGEVEAEFLHHSSGDLIFTNGPEILIAIAAGTWKRCFRKDMLPPEPYDDPFNRPVPHNPDERRADER